MSPPEPANDERPPLWPGMSHQTSVRLQWVFVVAGLTAIYGSAILGLDARHWVGLGITIGIASAFIIGAALWRLIVYGRA